MFKGLCDKIHDEKLREQYHKSSRFEKTNLEDDFLAYLQKIDSDMHKKINRNKQRLDLTQPGGQVKIDLNFVDVISCQRESNEKNIQRSLRS